MFCNHCGKEIPNNAKFCNFCGKEIGIYPVHQSNDMQMPNNSNQSYGGAGTYQRDTKTMFMYAMTGATICMGICNFFPILSGNTEILKWLDIDDSLGIQEPIMLLMLIATAVFVLASLFFAGKFLLNMWCGVRGYDLANSSLSASWCQVLSLILQYLLSELMNSMIRWDIFEFASLGWFMLIIGLANIFIFVKGYLGEKIVPGQSGQYQENQSITSEKTCLVCNTTYVLGSVCPKCGSKATK